MDAGFCWELFCATGEPMAYVLYCGSVEKADGIKEYIADSKEFTTK